MKRILSLSLAIIMALGLTTFPAQEARAEDNIPTSTFDLAAGAPPFTETDCSLWINPTLYIKDGANIEITGAVTGGTRIEVETNATATITLKNVSITGLGGTTTSSQTPLKLEPGAKVTLYLEGENTLAAGSAASQNSAGILAPAGTELTIYGPGSLTASGGGFGAGIGGGLQVGSLVGGKITINSGTVTARGGSGGAGIGGGTDGNGGTITINGGTVTATGFANNGTGAGIGGGGGFVMDGGNIVGVPGGNITINGGTVTATGGPGSTGGGGGAGIGGGSSGQVGGAGGTITITGGTVTATGGGRGAGIGGGGGYASLNQGTGGAGGNITISGGLVTAITGNAAGNGRTAIGRGGSGTSGTLGTDGTVSITGMYNYWAGTARTQPAAKTGKGAFTYSNTFQYIKLDPNIVPPVLTPGTGSRNNDATGSVTFISDEAGAYYYAVTDKGAGAPGINTSGAGTACTTAQTTVNLTGLTAGEKDVYIVVKDGANLVSDPIKIELPVPTLPTLTPGYANRINEATGYVKFTSDKAGAYYYEVVDKGASAPTIATSGAGTSCNTSEQTINLTGLTAGEKDVYVLVKDTHGNVSLPIKFEVPANRLPALTAGAVSRTSDTTAMVKFTSDTAGEYYYEVVEKDAAETTIDTSGEGTACNTSEQTINLTGLTAGEKDVYVLVKDTHGNVSAALKIEIPVFVDTSGIGTVSLTDAPAPHINLTAETIDLGSFSVAAYSLDGGKKWRKGELPTDAKLAKLFDKGMTLWVTDAWNDKDVKEDKKVVAKKGVPKDAMVLKFPKIDKRPKANPEKLKPFYAEEAWHPYKNGAATPTGLYEWASSSNGKTPDGDWTALDGNGFAIKEPGTKETVLLRTAPIAEDGKYTPACKPFKVKPKAMGKEPKLKANEKKGILKLKKGMFYQVEGGTPVGGATGGATELKIVASASGTGQVTGGSTIVIWTAATGKKPPSAKQTLTLPAAPEAT